MTQPSLAQTARWRSASSARCCRDGGRGRRNGSSTSCASRVLRRRKSWGLRQSDSCSLLDRLTQPNASGQAAHSVFFGPQSVSRVRAGQRTHHDFGWARHPIGRSTRQLNERFRVDRQNSCSRGLRVCPSRQQLGAPAGVPRHALPQACPESPQASQGCCLCPAGSEVLHSEAPPSMHRSAHQQQR